MMKKLIIFLIVMLSAAAPTLGAAPAASLAHLRCEYLDEPLGIDAPAPRFTWEAVSGRDFRQSTCRVSVATSPELLLKGRADVWRSERIAGDLPRVVYAGPALKPHTRYYWSVEAWDAAGRRLTSAPAWFETAKMAPADWSAAWISDTFDKEFRKAPLLRREAVLEAKPIRSARLYVSGVGYYEMYINGTRVGDHELDPGYTHFDKRVLYATCDVTGMLTGGENVLSAVLGNGWLNIQSLAVWEFERARWRMRPRLLAELRVTYADGEVRTIPTDTLWRTNTGASVYNNLYSGEVCDARLDRTGWMTAGYDASDWRPAREVEAPAPLVCAQQMPPIRVVREVEPVSMRQIDDRTWVYDLGENMTGVCRLRAEGPAGCCVTLCHGELVSPDGRVNQSNIDVYFQREKNGMPQHRDPREVLQTDTWYLAGGGEETFVPKFTYHGFRYVEVHSTEPLNLNAESLTGLCMHTDVESVGDFACSDEVLNQLFAASRRSYLGNLHSIPTDCPQREKNGWTADGYVAMDYGLLNFDGITVYEKWMNDFVDNQRERGDLSGIIPSSGWGYADWIGPVWDAALFIIPNNLYLYYGDTRAMEQVYATCERYLDYLQTREKDGALTYGIGDWVFYKAKTDTHFTSTAFYWLDNELMARFADLLGRDGARYRAKAEELRELILGRWYDADRRLWANGTQAAQAVGLAFCLTPEADRQAVADNLVTMIRDNDHQLDFGMLGSKFAPAMLTAYGYADDAYRMITRPDSPSWANWMARGLTTLPETWVLDENFKDASLNHAFLGDVSAWMMNTIAGIGADAAKPGFGGVVIRPHFLRDLDWARGEYRSVRGLIRSEWRREGPKIVLTVTVPANTEATLCLGQEKPAALRAGINRFAIDNR